MLVVLAIIAILISLLLPAVQSAREAAGACNVRITSNRSLSPAHNFAEANQTLPPGASLAPSEASALVFLLGYSDNMPLYNTFNLSVSVTNDPSNATARSVNLAVYNCPSDTSSGYWANPSPQDGVMGRSNYFGNLGTCGWVYDQLSSICKPAGLVGVFSYGSATRFADVLDGTSNTAMFAEIKRGANPGHDQFDVTLIPVFEWGMGSPATNPFNLLAPPQCQVPAMTYSFTGLQFENGFFMTALYTHTAVPNYRGRDCLVFPIFNQGHLASRSNHSGGVNVALADGSVKRIGDSIQFNVWQALGTRKGGEIISSDSY